VPEPSDEEPKAAEPAPEQREVKEGAGDGPQIGTRYSAAEIHENVLEAAEEELGRPFGELAWSALASGLLIGFSFLATALLQSVMPPHMHAIAAAIGYPLGFMFVVMGRHQLFTENTLEPVIPLLERRSMRALRRVLRLWAIVLPLNLIGAAIFGLVVARTNLLEPTVNAALVDVSSRSIAGGFLLVFYRAIWAGWLVALMAWLVASTRESLAQLALVWLTTAPIAAFGFKHAIVGSVEGFFAVFAGRLTLGSMLYSFELPALLGNLLGGVVLVALVNHGQVTESSQAKRGTPAR
jgi:formate/nitrite transporter FocA (FNT family)